MVKRSNSSIWSGNITQFAQAATAKNDGKCRCQRAELGLFMKNTTSEGFNHRKLGFHGYKLVVYLMMIWLVISFLFSSIWGDDLIWWISRGETCWNHLPNQRRIEDLGSYGFITQLWFSGEPKNPGHRWKLWPLSLCWEGEASLRLEYSLFLDTDLFWSGADLKIVKGEALHRTPFPHKWRSHRWRQEVEEARQIRPSAWWTQGEHWSYIEDRTLKYSKFLD
jgi:hypothetical protein